MNKHLRLAPPQVWEDPFELLPYLIQVEWKIDGRLAHEVINQSLPPVFAQCWSATVESDTFLRAYSRVIKHPHTNRNTCPHDEAVLVRSTPRKLLQALLSGRVPRRGQWFIGAVKYGPKKHLYEEIGRPITRVGLRAYEAPSERARLHLLKRDAFAHEPRYA